MNPLIAAGTNSANTLLKTPSAQSAALAEAFSAVSADIGGIPSLHYNPASPAFLNMAEISVMGQRGIADDSFGTIFLGVPTTWGNFSGNFMYYGLGDIDLIDTLGKTTTVKAQEDLVFAMNYSEKLYEKYGTGVSLKILRSKLVDTLSANAIAFDFGGLVKFFDKQLSVGFSVQNLGSNIAYIDVGESLPQITRGGAAYQFSFKNLGFESWGDALISLDFVKERDQKLKSFIAAQYLWNETIAFRLGYKINQDEGSLSGGFGFLIQPFQIDYAITNSGSLGKTHTASLTYRFSMNSDEKNQPKN